MSDSNSAASTYTDSPQSAAVDTAADSAGQANVDAASGPKDTIAKLDSDYAKNMLSPEESEAQAEPETPTEEPETPETVEAEAAEQPEVAEPDEERTGPRTIDELKKQFPRVSVAPLEEIARVEAQHFALQSQIDAIGGELGLELSKTLMPTLLSPATAETATAFLQATAETNPGLLQACSWDFLTHALQEKTLDADSGKEIRDVTGDALIKQFIDPELSLDDVLLLAQAKKAGLIDAEELKAELETYTGKSERELALEARLKAIEDGQKQEQSKVETETKARIQQHVDKTENYVSHGAMEQIVALAQENGWTATKEELASSDPAVRELAESKIALGKLLTPWLNDFIKTHPKWAGVENVGRSEQAFNEDGNPTKLLKHNGQQVINAAVAEFKSFVRVFNRNLAKSLTTSRNAKLKAKIQTRSGAVETSEIPPVKRPEETPTNPVRNQIDALDEQYKRTVRESRASL